MPLASLVRDALAGRCLAPALGDEVSPLACLLLPCPGCKSTYQPAQLNPLAKVLGMHAAVMLLLASVHGHGTTLSGEALP